MIPFKTVVTKLTTCCLMNLRSSTRGGFCITSGASCAPHFVFPQQCTGNKRTVSETFINSPLHAPLPVFHSHQICNRVQTVFRPRRRRLFSSHQSPGLPPSRASSTLAMGLEPEVLPARHWITRSYGVFDNLKLEDVSVAPPVCCETPLVTFFPTGDNLLSNQLAML